MSQRARREEAAQIAIALFADTAELVLAPARVLLRNEPNPGRKIPPRPESLRISDAGDQSGGAARRMGGQPALSPFRRNSGKTGGWGRASKIFGLAQRRCELLRACSSA